MKLYVDESLQQAHESSFVTGRVPPREVLPPGLSKARFDHVLQQFRSVVGPENVHTGSNLLNFVDPFGVNEDHIPSAAVCPASVNDIQNIVRMANCHKIPLWTTSKGKNLGYGGPAPLVLGSVVVSLHRMSQILEVNEKMAYAVVEPGVSFHDLAQHCTEHNPSVWPSVPFISWGSVVGNTLDRGFGYNPLGEHHHHICGLEVVLPNGELLRTGQWAADNCSISHTHKSSFGPQVDGLFLQSNLGIVTKMGIGMYPRPQAYMSLAVHGQEHQDLEGLIEAFAQLRREDIIQNDPLIGNILGAVSTLTQKSEYYQGKGPIPPIIIEKMKQDFKLGHWIIMFDFYGTEDMILARLSRTKEVLTQRCPSAKLEHTLHVEKDGKPLDNKVLANSTRPEVVGMGRIDSVKMVSFALPPDGGHPAHTDFVPVLPHDSKFALRWVQEAEKICKDHGFDAFTGGHIFKKHLLITHMIYYDSDNKDDTENVQRLWTDLEQHAKNYNLTNYRSHLDNMGRSTSLRSLECMNHADGQKDRIQDVYNYNNHAYRRFVEDIKVLPQALTKYIWMDRQDANQM
ncbi:hypothetical protein N7517_000169 [Penicillium concentricum]|uniref:FAD-binding PCMH-type domain-containing protein n=1 Tax=Penicillium concentricum TaxID=293559 RepID=A0A9W9STL5_9EURO|nr:uncharacterized protein N7517_000169 [Penicillium concentricum]KAJ5382258.1 hypothetical protein N7517_000169 [Penicillium concentricum]